MDQVSFATFNLLNLNEPGLPMYRDRAGWSQEEYEAKLNFTARLLIDLDSDVIGFQELWHHESLSAAFERAGLADDYDLIVPDGHTGRITCAAAVRKGLAMGDPEWIEAFPPKFKLQSSGDDAQTPEIEVSIEQFSRPVLHIKVKAHPDEEPVSVFVCHLKSKSPTQIWREDWYKADKEFFKNHAEGLGAALSTIRRTAEAAALRMMISGVAKQTNTPVVVIGDLNDGKSSNTVDIITGQPNYLLSNWQSGGGDVDLYTAQTLQEYQSERDVYYTHVYKKRRSSLDHILFSQEFYDASRKRVWGFGGLTIENDHLNREDHKSTGSNDHGIVKVKFLHKPVTS
ncbi:MAG: endonuclease/exonuclease/phosphatase family protein [Hyphomonadaceae bacterium]|nr:endonuclease/exonuclease/phosphatase family protein [Hyphomonadaceae bacterium]